MSTTHDGHTLSLRENPKRLAEDGSLGKLLDTSQRVSCDASLCAICETIDFEALLTFMPSCSVGTVELGRLADDSRSTTCPLCGIIVSWAKDVLASVAVCQWDKIAILGKPSKVPGSDHLRTSKIGPAYRLEIVANLQISNVGWRDVPLGALDMCEGSYMVPNDDYSFAMFRRPRHHEFRTEMLRFWLHTHCQTTPNIGRRIRIDLSSPLTISTVDPLHSLMLSGHFRLFDVVNREIIKCHCANALYHSRTSRFRTYGVAVIALRQKSARVDRTRPMILVMMRWFGQ
jgi:hypothetical protein